MKYIYFLLLITISFSCVAKDEKESVVEDSALFKVRGFDSPSQLFLAISTAQRSTLAGYFDYRNDSTVPPQYEPLSFFPTDKDIRLHRACPQAALRSYLYSRFGTGESVLSTCVFVNDNLKEALVLIYGAYAPSTNFLDKLRVKSNSIPTDYFRYTVKKLRTEKWQVETAVLPNGSLFEKDF